MKLTPGQLREKLSRLRADEQRMAAALDAVQQRITLAEAELADAMEAQRQAEAERRERAEVQRREREAAKARRMAECMEAERAREEAAEQRARERLALEGEAVERIKALAVRVADAASRHYETTVTAQAITSRGGTRRVNDARRALVWLGREREGVTLRVLALVLGRCESDICQAHQRAMSVDAAAIVRLVILGEREAGVAA